MPGGKDKPHSRYPKKHANSAEPASNQTAQTQRLGWADGLGNLALTLIAAAGDGRGEMKCWFDAVMNLGTSHGRI